MRVLITGSDGSLGSALALKYGAFAVCLENRIMREGKIAIEQKIDSYLQWVNITHVINNYGINQLSWIGDTPQDDQMVLTENVMPAYWVINHLVRAYTEKSENTKHKDYNCRVINVASATYRVPQRCTSLYCASKAAVVQMTKVMARELAPKGWVINAIAPGLIEDTKMAILTGEQVKDLRGWTQEEADNYAMKLVPMGRATKKEEVVEAIDKIFNLPDYINGTCIDMMGGV